MYTDIFNIYFNIINWLTTPVITNLLLLGFVFGIAYRFFKWSGF